MRYCRPGLTDETIWNFMMNSEALTAKKLTSLHLGRCSIGALTTQVREPRYARFKWDVRVTGLAAYIGLRCGILEISEEH